MSAKQTNQKDEKINRADHIDYFGNISRASESSEEISAGLRNSGSIVSKDNVPPTVLAISSGGGHWVQLLRLRPAFEDCRVVYATVKEGYRNDVGNAEFCIIPDANRWSKFNLLRSTCGVFVLLLRLKPDVVISTGAAPGYLALRLAKLLGARTIWVDSVANAEELSLSGEKIGRFADLWLTQWPHLAREQGPHFRGNVL